MALEWPPLWALALRFAIVAPLLWAIWHWRGRAWPARGDLGRLAVMGAFGMGGYLACAWVASAHVPSGLVALLAWVLRQRGRAGLSPPEAAGG